MEVLRLVLLLTVKVILLCELGSCLTIFFRWKAVTYTNFFLVGFKKKPLTANSVIFLSLLMEEIIKKHTYFHPALDLLKRSRMILQGSKEILVLDFSRTKV